MAEASNAVAVIDSHSSIAGSTHWLVNTYGTAWLYKAKARRKSVRKPSQCNPGMRLVPCIASSNTFSDPTNGACCPAILRFSALAKEYRKSMMSALSLAQRKHRFHVFILG